MRWMRATNAKKWTDFRLGPPFIAPLLRTANGPLRGGRSPLGGEFRRSFQPARYFFLAARTSLVEAMTSSMRPYSLASWAER